MNPIVARLRSHPYLFSAGLVVALAVAAGFALRAKKRSEDALSEPLKKGTIIESVYGIGTVTAKNSFQLKLGVTGRIRAIFVKEGDRVKRGQRLIELDDSGVFTAPFEGTITLLPSKAGETVYPQAVVLGLVDLLDRYLLVSLEQRGALRVRPGQKARISFDSLRENSFEGTVQSIYSLESNFLVRVGVPNLPAQFLPGMTADVAIGIREHENALLVPVAALSEGKVRMKRGRGRASEIAVVTGVVDDRMAEVVSGDLHEGDRVVLRKSAR